MQFLKLVRRCGTHRGNPRSAQIAHVMESPEEVFEKRGDPVWTCKHQPVIRIQLQQRIHEVFAASGRLGLDRGYFQHFRAQVPQSAREQGGLLASDCGTWARKCWKYPP